MDAPETTAVSTCDATTSTILIVDDQPENLQVLTQILKPHYRIRATRSGEKALRIAATEPKPELILLDVMMPEMDGFAVLEQLMENPATRDIPVIFVTARDTPEDELRGFDRGAVDYITKPIRPSVVLARARLHLALKHAHDRLAEENIQLEERVLERTRALERSQRQVLQAEKMAAVGTLAGGIAHDFNNILSPIIGYTEMAMEEIGEGHPLYKDLKQVFDAGHRAKDLVAQILTFARKTEFEKKPVRISLIIKEVLKLLRATLPSTVELRQTISPEAAYGNVLGDPTQIHQILMNLCTNAAHAMKDDGGTIEVTLVIDMMDSSPDTARDIVSVPCLRLSISDTGHGMTEDLKRKIFEPYFTTKSQGEGTGLGLAVVYGIVQSLKGAITVESQPEVGTTFHVRLPLIAEPLCSEEAPFITLPIGRGRALFVDDEIVLVEMGEKMLNRLGYEVVAVNSSMDALNIFREEPYGFDLIVSDQTMPQMTGMSLAREILAIRKDIPIILCSGFSETVSEERARSMGIRELLMKPLSIRTLSNTIQRILEEADTPMPPPPAVESASPMR